MMAFMGWHEMKWMADGVFVVDALKTHRRDQFIGMFWRDFFFFVSVELLGFWEGSLL